VIEALVIAALALNGILCTAALVWLLRRAGLRRDREWVAELALFDLPDKLEPPGFELEPPGRYPSREIVDIMAEHYPVAFERYRLGSMERAERAQVWDACCAIHDARYEIEELCS
jgi:hypothetical protein